MKTLRKLARRLPLAPDVIAIMAVFWGMPLAIVVGYFIQLPDAMAAGVPPLESFSIYVSEFSISLYPYTVPLLGILTFYLYAHVACVPLANSSVHESSRARVAFHAVASLLLDASLSLRAWWHGHATECTLPDTDPTTTFRPTTQADPPRHLSIGWSPGTHPLVLYG